MSFIQKLFKRKIILIIACLIIIGGGYYAYKSKGSGKAAPQYMTALAEKGTLTVSVSGTGQVSNSNQIEVKPLVSGKVINVLAEKGKEVEADAVLFQLDAKEALKAVRDAEVNLQSARLSLEKLKKPATEYSIFQAESALASTKSDLEKLKLTQEIEYQKAQDAKQKAKDNIAKAYEDAFNSVSNVFLDMPTVITGLNNTLYGTDISSKQVSVASNQDNASVLMNTVFNEDRDKMQPFWLGAGNDYKTARAKYDENFSNYKNTSRYSSSAIIEALLSETIESVKSIGQAAKSESNFIDTWVDIRTDKKLTIYAEVKTMQTNLSTYTGQINSHLSTLLSIQRTLQDNKESLTSAEQDLREMDQNNPLNLAQTQASIKEKENSLAELKAGVDSLDIKSQELSVKQRENALLDAREKLADYSIRAPFSGIIAAVNLKKGDNGSSGSAAATLITKQQVAEISLNEVDVAKIKVGQKVSLIFEAIENLSISGNVAEIDTIGTVTQGVVYYAVKITFDTQDERVKPGMSISANIITDIKSDIIFVPSAAVKTQNNGNQYVEIMDGAAPVARQVSTGIFNDSSTEIISGINEGDKVVTQTIDPNATSNQATQQRSIFSSFGSGGGGQFRSVGR